ncbi:MAG: heavy metal sensor histidine kinase [Dehalococcoidia bacterium]
MRRLRSIRVRLTLWYVVLLAVILAAFSAGIYLTLRYSLSSNLNDSLTNRANILLGIVQYEDGRPTLDGLVSTVDQELDEQVVRVYDGSGAVSFDSSSDIESLAIDPEAIQDALDGRSSTRTVQIEDETLRARIVPISQSEQISGVLVVGLTEDDMVETLRSLLLILAIAYPVTLVVASAGGIFLAGRALSPIDKITRLAQRISADDLSQRLDATMPDDEVGQLARTFNEMIARLDAAFQRQRQFTADASHEMRTPLTAIKGQIEVALSRPREAEAYRDVLQGANEEVDRLIRLVGSLLTLARADAGEIPLASEPVRPGDLVASAVEHVRPAAAQKEVTIDVEAGADVTLQADQDLLLQLLLNLLDNALKYTPQGGHVTAGWSADGTSARIWVRDTGIGIAAEEQQRIFDRFYRVDKARSRAAGGSGLGLSISRWIADAHGGTISVESGAGQGALFTVTLPLPGRA